MATINQVVDEYVVRPKVEGSDAAKSALAALADQLSTVEGRAKLAADAAANLGQTMAATGEKVGKQSLAFTRAAEIHDVVTKAAANLEKAQRTLQQVVDAGAIAVNKLGASQEQVDRTTAPMIARISQLAEKLGQARAQAEANTEATARWNGVLAGGSQSVTAFATSVADMSKVTSAAAIEAKQAQDAFSAWMADASKFDKINAALTRMAETEGTATVAAREAKQAFSDWMAESSKFDKINASLAEMARTQGTAAVAAQEARQAFSDWMAEGSKFDRINAGLTRMAETEGTAVVAAREARQAFSDWMAEGTKFDRINAALLKMVEAQKVTVDVAKEAQVAFAAWLAEGTKFDRINAALRQMEQTQGTAVVAAREAKEAFSTWMAEGTKFDRINAALRQMAETEGTAVVAARAAKQAFSDWLAEGSRFAQINANLAKMGADQVAAASATASQLENLRNRVNGIAGASAQYARDFATLNDLQSKGVLVGDDYNRMNDLLNQNFKASLEPTQGLIRNTKNLTAEQNNQRFAARQLGVQTVQFFSSLEAGAPFMLALIGQLHQVGDVALATGTGFEVFTNAIRSAATAIGAFVIANPAVVALAAFAAALTVGIVHSENAATRMHDLQNTLRGTRDDYLSLTAAITQSSRALAASSNISTPDAAAIQTSIGKNPLFDPSTTNLGVVTKQMQDIAAVAGVAATAMAEKFGGAMSDAGKLAQEFADKHLFHMDQIFADSIKIQVQSGDALGAWTRVLAQASQQSVGAAQPASDLSKAWNKLKEAFTGAGEGGRSLMDVLGDAMSAWAQTALRLIREVINAVNWARGVIPGGTTGSTPSIGAAVSSGTVGPNGVLKNPNSSALGLGQILSGTALDLGIDPTDARQNIEGVFKMAAQLQAKFPTNPMMQVGGYIGPNIDMRNRTDVASAAAYAKIVNATDASKLPPDTVALINQVGQNSEKYVALIDRVSKFVMHESAGNQFAGGVGLNRPGAAALMTPAAKQADTFDKAQSLQISNAATDAKSAAANVLLLTDALKLLGPRTKDNADQFDSWTQKLQGANKQLEDAIPATDQQGRASDRELGAMKALTAARAESVSADVAQQARNDAIEEAHTKFAETDARWGIEVEKLTQQKLAQAEAQAHLNVVTSGAQTDREIVSQKAIADAAETGNVALARRLAQEKAVSDLTNSRFTPDMLGYAQALEDATQRNLDLATAQGGVTINKQTDQTKIAADQQGRLAAAYRVSLQAGLQMTAQIQAENDARAAGLEGSLRWTDAVNKRRDALLSEGQAAAQAALAQSNLKIDDQIRGNVALADAYSKSNTQIAAVTASEAARADLIAQKVYPGTVAYGLAIGALTNRYLALGQTQQHVQFEQESKQIREQTTVLQAEIATLGANSDARTLYIQHLKDAIDISDKYKNETEDVRQKLLGQRDALAALNLSYQNQQAALSYLAGQFSQAFDTIGNAMAQAFIQGQGAAVNWRNVMSAVAQQVIQAFLRLAVLNPLLNSLFGQNSPTLSSVTGTLGGGGSGGGGTSSLGTLSSIGSLASNSGILNSLGLGDIGGSLGLTGSGGALSFLGSAVPGAFTSAATPGTLAFANAAGLSSAAGGAVTFGQLLGGAGAGFAAGSLAGGLLQGALGKTGPAPMIGAGLGAGAGALVGTFLLPGLGTLAGGLIGGVLGGGGGAFIGPHVANPYTSEQVTVGDNGLLGVGRVASQITDNGQELAQLQADIATLNTFLTGTGIKVANARNPGAGFASPGALFQVGTGGPSAKGDLNKVNDLASGFSTLRFSSGDPLLNSRVLNNNSFGSMTELQTAVTNFAAAEAAVTDFLTNTAPALLATGKTTGTYNDQMLVLNTTFDAAIKQLHVVGDSAAATDDQLGQLRKAEDDLTDARQRAKQAAIEAIAYSTNQTDVALQARLLTAQATLSGSQQGALDATLYQFDNATAVQARKDLSDQLVGVWGDSIKGTQPFADQMATLERTLAAERLVIVKQGNDAILQAQQQNLQSAQQSAQSLITNLTQYAQKLQTGSASPLSPQAQYDLASSQFNAVAGAAKAGDFNSMQQLTTFADTLLQTSRVVFGSGAQYAADFKRIEDVIQAVGNMTADQLTADAMAALLQSQTTAIVTGLDQLRITMLQVLAQLKSNGGRPSSLAA